MLKTDRVKAKKDARTERQKTGADAVIDELLGKVPADAPAPTVEPDNFTTQTVNELQKPEKKSGAGRKPIAPEKHRAQMTITVSPTVKNKLDEVVTDKMRPSATIYLARYIERHIDEIAQEIISYD